MRIQDTDLSDAIETAIKEINSALYNLRINDGIIVEMPESLEVEVEMVTTFSMITRNVEDVDPGSTVVDTTVDPEVTQTETSTPGGQKTISSGGGSNQVDEKRTHESA